MIGEHKFIIDVVLASLTPLFRDNRRAVLIITNLHCRVKFDLFGSDIRLVDKGLDHVPLSLSGKSWGSPSFHRPVLESSSFLRLPFREQALGTVDSDFVEWFVR
jgi:hypothetical protein